MRADPRRPCGLAALLVVLTAGCTTSPTVAPTPSPSSAAAPPASPGTAGPTAIPTPPATPSRTASPRPRPARFEVARVQRDIEHLAGDIGPREATSDGFAEAADWVEDRFDDLGYRVRTTRVRVPAGNSWGTPVRHGTSRNVLAEPLGFDPDEPHVVVGAHLDTVPVAPGAEDNASGVAVMLELARLAAAAPPEVPVQFVAFGAEEPRGAGDARHHFGSQQLVADLPRRERDATRAMVALDRVGVRAGAVPVCRGGPDGTGLRAELRAAGRDAGLPTRACESQASDHWSYEKVGVRAARIGGVPYAVYHTRRDVPSVVDRRQLDRVGRLVWTWLSGLS